MSDYRNKQIFKRIENFTRVQGQHRAAKPSLLVQNGSTNPEFLSLSMLHFLSPSLFAQKESTNRDFLSPSLFVHRIIPCATSASCARRENQTRPISTKTLAQKTKPKKPNKKGYKGKYLYDWKARFGLSPKMR